jgi:invasion protein IalB
MAAQNRCLMAGMHIRDWPMQNNKNMVVAGLLAGAAIVAFSNVATAIAQQQRPASSEAPQRTTVPYGNWVLTCDKLAGPPPQKTCELLQVVQEQVQGKAVPFSSVAVMQPVKGQAAKMAVQVQNNVTLSRAVGIQTTDADAGIVAPFARCAPIGCFAEFELRDDVVQKFRSASGNGKITYADSTGREIVIPISFNGFGQALDALAKE